MRQQYAALAQATNRECFPLFVETLGLFFEKGAPVRKPRAHRWLERPTGTVGECKEPVELRLGADKFDHLHCHVRARPQDVGQAKHPQASAPHNQQQRSPSQDSNLSQNGLSQNGYG